MRVFLYYLFRSPRKLARVTHKRGKRRIRRELLVVKAALAQEREETLEMLVVYKKFTHGEASKEEMKEANEQMFDLIKGLGVGIFAVLPFAPVTIPFLIHFGKRFGIDVLPSAFYEKDRVKNIDIKAFKKEIKEEIKERIEDRAIEREGGKEERSPEQEKPQGNDSNVQDFSEMAALKENARTEGIQAESAQTNSIKEKTH